MIPVCPKCDEGLFILTFKGVEVDFCHRCRGVWLDAGELELLMHRTGAHAEHDPLLKFQRQHGTLPRGRKHLCPRCDKPLHEITVRKWEADSVGRPSENRASETPSHISQQQTRAPLTLDRCPRRHGLWFDADELQQL